jgi:hypothetical protein
MNSFWIYRKGDEYRFPLIGTDNADIDGNLLMSDEEFRLLAYDVLGAYVRTCKGQEFDIVWEDVNFKLTDESNEQA